MEKEKRRLIRWRASRWERRLLTAMATALSAEIFFNIWAENFRVSAAVVIYPVLLLTLMQDSRKPGTGALTSLVVLVVRSILGMLSGESLIEVLQLEYSGALFYLCYDALLCFQVRDRGQAALPVLWRSFWVCDMLSNVEDLTLSKGVLPSESALLSLVIIGLIRATLAVLILWGMNRYRRLLLAEEHERRYQRLFLMTANLKNELYFLKKDTENIEGVMTRAYKLYERLGEGGYPEELRQLALSIARDVHEVKKDNLSIIRGIEGEVSGTYDDENMRMSDLFLILKDTMRHILGEKQADIGLECRCNSDFSTKEHYRLMSILKNLVINAAEAIQSGIGTGMIWVEEQVEEGDLILTVQDNGPGISERAMRNLFRVGYSTKFDPETGNISRGIGLPAVEFMVKELGGSIAVSSGKRGEEGERKRDRAREPGACFRIRIPMKELEKGEA